MKVCWITSPLLLFHGEARSPQTCAKRIVRVAGDGKVHRGVYLMLYNTKLSSKTTYVWIFPEDICFAVRPVPRSTDPISEHHTEPSRRITHIRKAKPSYQGTCVIIVRQTLRRPARGHLKFPQQHYQRAARYLRRYKSLFQSSANVIPHDIGFEAPLHIAGSSRRLAEKKYS